MRSELQVQRKCHFQKSLQIFFFFCIPFCSTLQRLSFSIKNMHTPGVNNMFSNLQIKAENAEEQKFTTHIKAKVAVNMTLSLDSCGKNFKCTFGS